MKKILYCLLLLSLLCRGQAQNTIPTNSHNPITSVPDMSLFAPINGISIGADIAIDKHDNVYIIGQFTGTASFGTLTITSNGKYDLFIAKYDKAGIVQWVKGVGGKGYDFANSIVVDDNGDVYITGSFYGNGNFGLVAKTIHNNDDIFLAKYKADGNLMWVKWAGGLHFDAGMGLALDKAGNIYLTGFFARKANFGSITKSSGRQADIFVAKYTSQGEVVWVHSAEGKKFDMGTRIAVDDNGDAYITGLFYGTARFDSKVLSSKGKDDIFIAKYDGKGKGCIWVQSVGGEDGDSGRNIAVDDKGNVYISGLYRKTLNAGPLSRTAQGKTDIFLAKYSSNGQLEWLQSAGGVESDRGDAIVLDGNGHIYLTGHFRGTARFGSISRTAKGMEDSFVAKYALNGEVLWVQSGGGVNLDTGDGIALDSKGNIFTTGVYESTAAFGRNIKYYDGRSDIFVIRLNK